MTDLEEAAELLEIAASELRALKAMDDHEVFTDELFGFVAQQSVEKSLKAWLCLLGQQYPLTHDVRRLLSELESLEQDVAGLRDLEEFTSFAVELRYARRRPADHPLDRAGVTHRAQGLVKHVRGLMEDEDEDGTCPDAEAPQ